MHNGNKETRKAAAANLKVYQTAAAASSDVTYETWEVWQLDWRLCREEDEINVSGGVTLYRLCPVLSHTAVCHSSVCAPSPSVSHDGYKSGLVHCAHSEHTFNTPVNLSTLIVTEPERLVTITHELLRHLAVSRFVREQIKVKSEKRI